MIAPDDDVERPLSHLACESNEVPRRKKEIRAEITTIESLIAENFPESGVEGVGSQKLGFDIRTHRVIDE